MKQVILPLVVCAFCLDGISQSQPKNAGQPLRTAASQAEQAAVPEDFVIGPEDVLEINVWKEPELNRKVTVRSDGKVSVPLLNDVHAGGLTTRQLQEQIEIGLSRFVLEPVVSVVVLEIRSKVVYILGSVKNPGEYQLGRPMTVVDLIARAGGLTEFAKKKDIVVVRQQKEATRRFSFNFDTFVDGRNFAQNIQLQSGDKVFVP